MPDKRAGASSAANARVVAVRTVALPAASRSIDAALDNVNVVRVAEFIRKEAGGVQFITISLKDTFYDKSDGLVGVYRNVQANSSASVTFDLRDVE